MIVTEPTTQLRAVACPAPRRGAVTYSDTLVTVQAHTPDEGNAYENLYVYGSDNPLAFLDPLGLWTLSLGVALSGQLGSFGGTAGFGVGISHDPSASLLSGWNAGVLGFAGYGLETPGASASFTFEPAYSGNPNLEDLSGGAMEIGGSVTPISGGPSVGGSYAQDTCGHKPLITFPSFGLGIGTPELHVFDVHTGVLSFDDARSSSTRPPK